MRALRDLADSHAELAQARTELATAHEAAEHWQEAVRSGRRIGMAMGVLMERHKLTAEQAFDRLRTSSQRSNVKLRDLAESVLYTGQDPESAED
jgi:AmiR/NasT family two-component response regulator